MTLREAIAQFDNSLQTELKNGLVSSGVQASGETAKSLRSESSNDRYTLFGRGFFSSVDFGRGKYKGGPPGGFLQKLTAWVELRKYGITFENEKQKMGIAWAIYTKIQQSGSLKHRDTGKRTNIIRVAIDKSLPGLINSLQGVTVQSIRDIVRDYKKNVESDNKK